jgi:CspA family cold shock protein
MSGRRRRAGTTGKEKGLRIKAAAVRGSVKWFNDSKGYGFIVREGDQVEIFVHYSAILGRGHRTLYEGDAVEFEVEQGAKGMAAKNVQVLGTPASAGAARTDSPRAR